LHNIENNRKMAEKERCENRKERMEEEGRLGKGKERGRMTVEMAIEKRGTWRRKKRKRDEEGERQKAERKDDARKNERVEKE
jgi:hypothetical protein